MAKGQLRSNKEPKKPKQAKKPTAGPSSSVASPVRPPMPAVGKKK
jgi:hypothetical protein